jgi:hypothetical protein
MTFESNVGDRKDRPMPSDTRALIDKIQALPAERIAEIEDFVDFIAARAQDRALVHAASAASTPPLQRSGRIRPTTSTMPFEFGDVVLVPFPSPAR